VIIDATGGDQIRDAFTTAADSVQDSAGEVADLAGTLTEAAEQYAGQNLAASTVGHRHDAAGSVGAAQHSLETAGEQLQAALDDFNNRDGRVADAVTEAGNLMQADGYAAAFTMPGTAAAENAAEAAGPADEPVMSPGEYLDALADLQDGVRWMSMNEGNPDWRPSEPTPELAAQLAADSKAEDAGMDADNRLTCYTHQSWLADCISDPSHSNPGTRDKPGSSFNWCTAHRTPVQVCACWPATVDGQPPAAGDVDPQDPLAAWRGSHRMSPKPVGAAWALGDDEFRDLVAGGLPEGQSLQQRAGDRSPWTDVAIRDADSCDHRYEVCVDCAGNWRRRLDMQIVEQRPPYEIPPDHGADEAYACAGDFAETKPPYWARREGRTVISQILGEPVRTTEYPDLNTARAAYAEESCDPDGAGAPATDDVIEVHWGDHEGQNLRVSAVTSGPGHADYVVEAQPADGGPPFSLTLIFGQYKIVRRPAAS
jgi:hypothetical protein